MHWFLQHAPRPLRTASGRRDGSLGSTCRWLGLAMAIAAALSGPLPADEPAWEQAAVDRAQLDDPDLEIEWRSDWDTTYEHNHERFREQIDAETDDSRQRQSRLHRRSAFLLDRMLDRFDVDAGRRLAAYQLMADHLARGDSRERSLRYLQRIVEEFDDAEVQFETLQIMVGRADPIVSTPEGFAYQLYASQQMLALAEAEKIDADDPQVARAHRLIGQLRRDQGRFFEARLAITDALAVGLDENDRQAMTAAFFDADRSFADVLSATKDNFDLAVRIPDMLRDLGRLDAAVAWYTSMLERWPADTEEGEALTERIERTQARAEEFAFEPMFAQNQAGRWDALADQADPERLAEEIQRLLDDHAAAESIAREVDRVRVSLWRAIDQRARASAAARRGLRRSQEQPGAAAAAAAGDDAQAVLAAFRQYPWASAVHEKLLLMGEQALRDGRPGAARRHFADVIARVADDALRSEAQAGLDMAKSEARAAAAPGSGDALDLDAMRRLAAVDVAAVWPTGFSSLVPLAALEPLSLLPVNITTAGDEVVVVGPGGVAVYGPDAREPRWMRRGAGLSGMSRGATGRGDLTLPTPMRPTLDDGRIYTRWGLDSSGRYPEAMAAFDQSTGMMLWATDQTDEFQGVWFIGDPVAAEGYVYSLAIHSGMITPVEVICLDADTGAMQWRRQIASQSAELMGPQHRGPLRGRQVDMVRYGSGLHVADGAVYAMTNMGLTARLDARDGMIDWVHRYDRIRLSDDYWAQTIRRHNGQPRVAGDLVLFHPRDFSGTLALHRDSGALAWQEPLLPTERVLGMLGDDSYLTADQHVVARVAADTGEVRWHRSFDKPITMGPLLADDAVVLAAGGRLHHLDARSGELLADRALPGSPSVRGLGVHAGKLLLLDDEPTQAGFELTDTSTIRPPDYWFNTSPERRFESSVRLPLARSGFIERAQTSLLVPAAEAKLGDRLILHSPGLIECFDPSQPARPLWHRPVERAVSDVLWGPGQVLLIGPGSVRSLDAATGRTAWRYEANMAIRRSLRLGPYLVLLDESGTGDSPRVAVLDAATGERFWSRDLGLDHGSFRVSDLLLEDDTLHLLGHFLRSRAAVRSLDVRTGEYLGEQPFVDDEKMRGGRAWDGRTLYFTGPDRRLYRWTFGQGDEPQRFEPEMSGLFRHGSRIAVKLNGPWVQVRQYSRDQRHGHETQFEHWTFHRDDLESALHRDRAGMIHEGRLFETHGSEVRVFDLREGEQVATYRLPPAEHSLAPRGLGSWPGGLPAWLHGRFSLNLRPGAFSVWVHDDTLTVATGLARPGWPHPRDRMRIDLFDLHTAEHLGNQMLPASHDAYSQLFVAGDHVLVTDPDGLHVFKSGSARDTPGWRAWIAHRFATTPDLMADDPRDWDTQTHRIETRDGQTASLRIGHDEQRIYLALTYPAEAFRPMRGRGSQAEGQRLEIAIQSSNTNDYRFALGVDARGELIHDHIDGDEAEQVQARIDHDPTRGELTYRLSLPVLTYGDRRYNNWRQLSMSLIAWDELETPDGASRTQQVTWGSGLRSDHHPNVGHEEIYLHRLSHPAEQALLSLAHALPDLPAGWAAVREAVHVRQSTSSVEPARMLRDFIRNRPDGLWTGEALVRLDQAMRQTGDRDPIDAVASFAAEAGVDEPVIERYRRQAGAELRQMVYIEPDERPTGLYVGLQPAGSNSFTNGAFWGAAHSDENLGSRYTTPAARWGGTEPPAGRWTELRMPLIHMNMQDTPIRAVRFRNNSASALWGATTIALPDGGRVTMIDGELPEDDLEGAWTWRDAPAGGQGEVHLDAGDPDARNARVVDRPIADHLVAPPGPTLSAWVYLNPDHMPSGVAVQLHDGVRWHRAAWGGWVQDADQFLGPLPEAGGWHELRMPLAWLPIAGGPIVGAGVVVHGGQAYWDRLTLEVDNQRTTLIDGPDEMLGPTSGGWQWTDEPARLADGHSFTRPPSGSASSANVYPFETPITSHLPEEPTVMIERIQAHLPRLAGHDDEAWDLLRTAAMLADDDARAEVYTWFAEAMPDHPQAADAVKQAIELRTGAGESTDEVIADLAERVALPEEHR